MSKIENLKSYSGQNLDTVFFRPMLTGQSAEELGIKVMYNVPMPTTLNFWHRSGDVLKKYSTGGWSGGNKSIKYQKTLQMNRVKAEMSYGADDYFSTVFELIAARADVNLDDLSGTELEEAETALFRAAIAESIRATMWLGDTSRSANYNTFNGLVKQIFTDNDGNITRLSFNKSQQGWGEKLLKSMWEQSKDQLKELRSEGNLAFFVSSDIYNAYEDELDSAAIEAAYLARQNGRDGLFYRGIPVVDLRLSEYADKVTNLPTSFAILTDRRNLALAVNTNEFPGSEVRMWYNPDLMENRQRAIFAAGCDYLLPELLTIAVESPIEKVEASCDGSNMTVTVKWANVNDGDNVYISAYDASGELICDNEEMPTLSGGTTTYTYQMSSLQSLEFVIELNYGYNFRQTFKL